MQTQTRVQTITITSLRLMYINDHTKRQYLSKRKKIDIITALGKLNNFKTVYGFSVKHVNMWCENYNFIDAFDR